MSSNGMGPCIDEAASGNIPSVLELALEWPSYPQCSRYHSEGHVTRMAQGQKVMKCSVGICGSPLDLLSSASCVLLKTLALERSSTDNQGMGAGGRAEGLATLVTGKCGVPGPKIGSSGLLYYWDFGSWLA